ncbi:MAG: FkbM family methyltransferase [Parachlamydiaceae bacterium]|nr:FkbM family methyltransferase [Parachlamydiaceae bacterium]
MSHHLDSISTIIDVGANRGQFAYAASSKYPNAKIYSFEPDAIIFNEMEKRLKWNKNIVMFNYALGNSDGTIDFFQNPDSQTSSILKIANGQLELDPSSNNGEIIKVGIKKLDSIIPEFQITSPALLKIDAQGYERYVLEGGLTLLESIDYILIEASFIRMYEGESLFDDLHSLLKSLRYYLIAPVGFLMNRKLKIYQIDFLYKRLK